MAKMAKRVAAAREGLDRDKEHTIAEAVKRNPGMVATAMHCVNSIPYVCEAPAGIRTYLDLPLMAGRAAR